MDSWAIIAAKIDMDLRPPTGTNSNVLENIPTVGLIWRHVDHLMQFVFLVSVQNMVIISRCALYF